jgi:hypothetical protein
MKVIFPLLELQSKKRISKTVTFKDTRGITKTITLTVEDPVSVAGCTTRERIYEDNANRSFLIYHDESEAQDEAIMQYQKIKSAGLVDIDTENKLRILLQNCQRLLQPISIKNPFAPLLQLPKEVFKPRRTNKHYLDFIEAIAFYHQFQRTQQTDESTGEIFIETTIEDITEANKLMKEILLRKSDGISGACRNYFEAIKKYLDESNQSTFTNLKTRTIFKITHGKQKQYMMQLQMAALIKRKEGDKKNGFHYEIVNSQEYQQLKNRIASVLDDVLEKIIAIQNPQTMLRHSSADSVKTAQQPSQENEQVVRQLNEVNSTIVTSLYHEQTTNEQVVKEVTWRTTRAKKNNTQKHAEKETKNNIVLNPKINKSNIDTNP